MRILFRKPWLASSIALILGGTAASFAADPDQQQDKHVADALHETQILTSFNMNRQLRPFDLTVRVEGNKAVLGGTVDEDICKALAERIATDADGIQSVENRIVVDANYSAAKCMRSDATSEEKWRMQQAAGRADGGHVFALQIQPSG
jgi:hyperosmotically inducible periplasmic protein